MRYSASEKAEIIQLVEQSHLPAKRTLDKLGIPRAKRYCEGGLRHWKSRGIQVIGVDFQTKLQITGAAPRVCT